MLKRLLLASTITAALALLAFAGTTMLSVNLSGVSHSKGSIIAVGGVTLIAVGGHVVVFDPTTHALITSLQANTPVTVIADMVFTPPSFLTVQGTSHFAATVDYSTSPPTVSPIINLP